MKRFSKGKALRKIFGTELTTGIVTLIPHKKMKTSRGGWRSLAGKYRWVVIERATKEGATLSLKTKRGETFKGRIVAEGICWGKKKAEVESYLKLKEIEKLEN